MLPGDALTLAPLFQPAAQQAQKRAAPAHHAMDKPRKPRSNGGPEGPWWRRPVRPE